MVQTKVRVHTLANEIGVESKAILAKCAAEGIVLANHMAVLTAGQEATIREWFSEGPHTTTEESSAPVDLTRIRKPRRRKPVETQAEPVYDDAPPAATEEAEAGQPPSTTVEAPFDAMSEEPDVDSSIVAAPPSDEPLAAEVEAAPEAEQVPPAAEAHSKSAAALVETRAPEAAAPPRAPARAAGPQLIPRPAELKGPRVVRIEKPDILPTPRPAARAGGLSGYSRGPAALPPAPGVTPVRRRGVAGKDRAGGEEDEDSPAAKKGAVGRSRINPRRSARDMSADVVSEKLREWHERDLLERHERLAQASGRTHRAVETKKDVPQRGRAAAKPTRVEMTEPIVIKEFTRAVGMGFDQVAPKLLAQGLMAGMNTVIDGETAALLALEFGVELIVHKALSPLEKLRQERAAMERTSMRTRPPVVTVLGHVDHGKTSLLDRIRRTKVAAGEAGGITQHIGAYRVKVGDRYVTFLDTPGHAAFTAMRARGAILTDVVVLVVAANDGVMPQTVEALNHAKAAKVPIVVALNKMDLPGVDINKIYGQLSEHQLTPQQWGGETDVIHTSATTGEGVDELLAHLAALSDLLELKADPTVPALGRVIEAEMKAGVGPVARVMVREGTLKTGNVLVCGPAYGKVRSMRDEFGATQKSAGPATPVEIAGLDGVPGAGDEFYAVETLQEAKELAAEVTRQRRDAELLRMRRPTDIAALLATAGAQATPELNVIIKADVQGSVDVLRKTVSDLPADQARAVVLHAGVGAVSESDVLLASASRAAIVAFNVVSEPATDRLAQEHGVTVRSYRVIYDVENDLRKALVGLLAPEEKLESRGRAEVRQVFNVTRVGRIAGCYVVDGTIARSHRIRVLRDSVPVKENGALASLRRFKDDAREVRAGLECGIRVDGFDDVKPGDIIEAYEVVKTPRVL